MPPAPTTHPRPATTGGGAGVRSLADDLRARSDADLAALLTARPDLARPTPGDLTALAARSTTRASTVRAIDALDRGALDVLTAAVVLDAPIDAHAVSLLLGLDPSDAARLDAIVDSLWRLALVWGETPRQVSRTAAEVLGPYAGGLGPTRAQLGLPASPAPDALPDGPRAVLESLTWGPPVAVVAEGTKAYAAARWLADHGRCALDGTTLTLPREDALALRGGRLRADTRLAPPEPAVRQWPPQAVDAAGGGSASEILALVDDLLASWSDQPPRVLKGGGLSARDLANAARALDVPIGRVALVLELAHAAGLLADDGEHEPHWVPTSAYDAWLDEPGGRRWALLVRAWWETTREPSLVGTHRDGRRVAALSAAVHRPGVRGLRRDLVRLLAALPPGAAPTASDLVAQLHWRRPRRVPADVAGLVDALLDEAAALGVVGLGALTGAGRVLVTAEAAAGADLEGDLAEGIRTHLPEPVQHVVLQADLTAVVPGPTSGGLAHFLRLAADLESRGGASVHRFSEAGIQRCLDAGWSVDDILTALADASSTPIPQPLDYLVRDTARRHGRLRVTSARAILRADDPGALDLVLADKELGALQLRRIAPTVAVSPLHADLFLDLLREAGHVAVSESDSGTIVVRESRIRRSRPSPTTKVHLQPIDEPTAYAIVGEMRTGEAASAHAQRHPLPALVPTGDPTMSLVVLREASADGRAVWVGYSDGAGAVRRFLFYPDHVEHGRVHGSADGQRRTLSIHRITGVAPH